MSTSRNTTKRRPKQMTKKRRGRNPLSGEEPAFARKALREYERYTMDRPIRSFLPTSMSAVIKHFGVLNSGVTTLGELITVRTNSALNTGWGMTVTTSIRLADLGRTYSRYRVIGYHLKVTAVPRNTGLVTVLNVFHTAQTDYVPAVGTAISATPSTVSPYNQLRLLPPATGSPTVVALSASHTIAKIVGSEFPDIEETYTGVTSTAGVASDPTNMTYAYIFAANISGAVFTVNLSPSWMIELSQEIVFFEPRQ